MFFENINGFHFRTLDSLYGEGSKGEYIYQTKVVLIGNDMANIEEDLKRVLSYEISSNNDTKKNIKSGMLDI